MFTAALTGYGTAFSLILAIGAQNAFVLQQGLLKQHVFWLCLLCAVSDAVLIAAGVAGFAGLVTLAPAFPTVMALGGAAFLLVYGALRLGAAWRGDGQLEAAGGGATLGRTLAVGAALTWLNPHVYLDTLGLIGAVSTRFPDPGEKLVFGIAATTASFSFFFGLGYGARLLAPVMRSQRAWQVLDAGVGLTMWVIAARLVASVLGA